MIHITIIDGHQSSVIRIVRLYEIQKLCSGKTITQSFKRFKEFQLLEIIFLR